MRRVTLERVGAIGGYRVAGTQIGIRRCSDGWMVFVMMRGQVDWTRRNHTLLSQTFPRLRDARDALEALLAVDALPAELMTSGQGEPDMKMIRAGKYRVTQHDDGKTVTAELTRDRHQDRGYWWRLSDKDGRTLGYFRTLSEARRGSRGRLAATVAEAGVPHGKPLRAFLSPWLLSLSS